MLIDATHAEETRVVVVDGNKVEEFDFESENKRQLAGNIYLAKVTRVEPSLQAAFVDYGGNRHGFLAFSEIHPDYYQIPVADREALMAEERAYAEAMRKRDEEEDEKPSRSSRSRRSKSSKASKVTSKDPVETREVDAEISGMETIDLSEDGENTEILAVPEGEAAAPEKDAETAAAGDDAQATPDAEVDAGEAPEAMETAEAEEATEEATEAPEAEAETAAEADTADSAEAPKAAETPKESAEAADDTAEDAPAAEAAAEDAGDESNAADESNDGQDEEPAEEAQTARATAKDKDSSIESVAEEDDADDLRPPRKPRPRRYKIQEVIKVRQILLVQVVKEERGNKGAALTTYLSLAGRYCVLMPNTARGGGISRKITNATDRKKLKEIAGEIDVPQGAGLIIRTAGAKRTKSEIKRDYEYLLRLWEQIRELTLKSIAPAKIYEEGDLIKRSIRDLYNREIDEVFVEGDRGYRIAKDFMKMIMPSHAKNVKKYEDPLPLFARYQVESYLGAMFNPTVQLKSGGCIVIGVTEALVAIDVNSGRATREGSIEETATKTNLEAAEEVARQLRLRDLAGLIVIDFIDMDERKNNSAVEKRLKDKLKTDRARIQVGRISGFGLLEMSRQRLRPGMIEATTQPCPACHGTGLIRSDDSMSLSILRQIEEEGVRRRSREVLIKCPVDIANFIMNQKREHIAQIEGRYGLSVRIEGDPHLVSPDFSMEKFKTASRKVAAVEAPVVSVDATLMDQIDLEETEVEPVTDEEETEAKPKKKRRRRRRKSSSSSQSGSQDGADQDGTDADGGEEANSDDDASPDSDAAPVESATDEAEGAASDAPDADAAEGAEEAPDAAAVQEDANTEAPAEETAESAALEAEPEVAEEAEAEPEVAAEPEAKAEAEPDAEPEAAAAPEPEPEPEESAAEPEPEPEPEPVVVAAPEPAAPPKPKRKGWWSLGGG